MENKRHPEYASLAPVKIDVVELRSKLIIVLNFDPLY